MRLQIGLASWIQLMHMDTGVMDWKAVTDSPEDGLIRTAPLPSCLTLIWPLKPLTYLFPLPAEKISAYRPAPLITTSPDLKRNKCPFLRAGYFYQLNKVTSMPGSQEQTEEGKATAPSETVAHPTVLTFTRSPFIPFGTIMRPLPLLAISPFSFEKTVSMATSEFE